MNCVDLVCRVVGVLDRAGVPNMVVGSIAANLYRYPRSTEDADIVIESPREVAELLKREFDDVLKLNPQLRFENVTGTTYVALDFPKLHFRVELFKLRDNPYDQERFRRRVRLDLGPCSAFVLTPEDVLLSKLRWIVIANRAKDLDDAMQVLISKFKTMDWDYLRRWSVELGVVEGLEKLLAAKDEYAG